MRKVKYSIILLLIMAILLGTVTYAWISLSFINNIEGMRLTATTGDELQISLDAEHYSSEISNEQLEEIFEDIRLTDVTSIDGINFHTGGLREVGIAVPNQDYLSFDLYFQTVEPVDTVYLVNNVSNEVNYDTASTGTYVVSQGVEWTTNIDFQNGPSIDDIIRAGTSDTYYGKHAIRMSFQELKDEENVLDVREQSELNTLIFDPSEDPSRGYGLRYGAYSYFIQRTRYYIRTPLEEPNTIYHLSDVDPTNPYVTYDEESLLLTLQETNFQDGEGKTYYRGQLKVNIWVEGWDVDAFDAIDKDLIRAQLQFKLLQYLEESPVLN